MIQNQRKTAQTAINPTTVSFERDSIGVDSGFFNARKYLSAKDIMTSYGISKTTAHTWMITARMAGTKMIKVSKIRRIEKAGFVRWIETFAL